MIPHHRLRLGYVAAIARYDSVNSVIYSIRCSILKNAKLSQYSGATRTLCWLDSTKIVVIHNRTGNQYPKNSILFDLAPSPCPAKPWRSRGVFVVFVILVL